MVAGRGEMGATGLRSWAGGFPGALLGRDPNRMDLDRSAGGGARGGSVSVPELAPEPVAGRGPFDPVSAAAGARAWAASRSDRLVGLVAPGSGWRLFCGASGLGVWSGPLQSRARGSMSDFVKNAVVLGLLGAVGPFAIDMYLLAMPDHRGRSRRLDRATQMTLMALRRLRRLSDRLWPGLDMAGRRRRCSSGSVCSCSPRSAARWRKASTS